MFPVDWSDRAFQVIPELTEVILVLQLIDHQIRQGSDRTLHQLTDHQIRQGSDHTLPLLIDHQAHLEAALARSDRVHLEVHQAEAPRADHHLANQAQEVDQEVTKGD